MLWFWNNFYKLLFKICSSTSIFQVFVFQVNIFWLYLKKICNGYTWCTLYLYFCLLFKFTCIYWSRYCSKNTFCNHHIPVVFSNFNLAYFQSVPEWLRLEAWVFFLYFCYKKKYTHVPSVKFWIWKVPFNTHCELCLSLLDFALGNHGWWNVGQCRS